MGRAPCCSKVGLHRGPWTPKEDALLTKYIQAHGEGQWRSLPKKAGLLRCGKSCRLRWMNYLRPDIKRGNITPEEDDLIIRMHSLLGNRWSLIAGRLPGRTDNEIKNHWNTHLSKRLRNQGADPTTQGKRKTTSSKNQNQRKSNKKAKVKEPKEEEEEEAEKKTIVYLPKPIRVTSLSSSVPRNDSFNNIVSNFALDSVSNSASGSTREEDIKKVNAEVWRENNNNDNNCNNYEEDLEIEEDGIVGLLEVENGSDVEGQSEFPTSADQHGTLEKLYEEYLQLLNNEDESEKELESFAESLFV